MTEQHLCSWCPVEVRALFATAHNAVLALDMARAGVGDFERAWRKLAELRETVHVVQPLLDAHFDATLRCDHPEAP